MSPWLRSFQTPCFILAIFLLAACESSPVGPASGSTTVTYGVPEASHVKVWVENSYNTTMVVLDDSIRQPGIYGVQFSANGWAGGVYFCIIRVTSVSTGETVQTERHILLVSQ